MAETTEQQLECGKCHFQGKPGDFGLDKPPGNYDAQLLCPRCHKTFTPRDKKLLARVVADSG